MKAIPLSAQVREVTGKAVKKLRKEGLLPITVYGKDIKSQTLVVPLKEFTLVFNTAGETGLIDLKVGNSSLPTLIAEVQTQPVTRQFIHAQFHAVKLTEKIKANVPLELVGESPVVASNVGIILETLNEIEVEALPVELPDKIEVDVSALTEVGQQITVGDLKISKDVEVLTGKEEIVLKVVPAVSEEAKKEAEEQAAKEEVEAQTQTPAAGTPVETETPSEEKAS